MNPRSRLTFFLSVFFLLTAVCLPAQENDKEKESFEFSSDSSRIMLAQGKKRIILSGNAEIKSETLHITADEIQRFGNDLQYTRCLRNVIAVDNERDIEIHCENLFFDTDSDTILIESFSELYDNENNVVTHSGYLFDKRKEDITLLEINVKIFKDTTVCRSEFARFDHKAGILELTGHPVIYRDGDEYSSNKIIYDLDSGEPELIGNVSGTIEADDEDE